MSNNETALEILVDLHNNVEPQILHDALQYMEGPVQDNPNMSAKEFLEKWEDFIRLEQLKYPYEP